MTPNESHTQRVMLVTGAASGMGRLVAQRMADAGATVVAADVNEAGLDETAAGRDGIRPLRLDVTDTVAVAAAVKEIEANFGPIDRVYNAAAIMPTCALPDQTTDEILKIMEINYGGLVNVTKAVLPGMLERGRGELVQFASVAGWMPSLHFGAYNASKFAVAAFSEVLHHETRDRGIRSVCVCPPPVATPLLEQATSRPKVLDQAPPIAPGTVLDAIDKALARGDFWVFPNFQARLTVWMRRFLPNFVWRQVHRIEGR